MRCQAGQWPAKEGTEEPTRDGLPHRPWETREVKERDSVLRRHHVLLPFHFTTLKFPHLWETTREGEGRGAS